MVYPSYCQQQPDHGTLSLPELKATLDFRDIDEDTEFWSALARTQGDAAVLSGARRIYLAEEDCKQQQCSDKVSSVLDGLAEKAIHEPCSPNASQML